MSKTDDQFHGLSSPFFYVFVYNLLGSEIIDPSLIISGSRKRKLAEPEAKRWRALSPSVAADLRLPPFNPKIPLGEKTRLL